MCRLEAGQKFTSRGLPETGALSTLRVSRKAEERARRKAAKQQRFDASKAQLITKVCLSKLPTRVESPNPDDNPRLAPHLQRAVDNAVLQPVAIEDGSRLQSLVTWCISKSDREGLWSWKEARAWSDEEWRNTILPAFRNFEALTWGDVDHQASGEGHKMHHEHELSDIHDEAQARWIELDLEQFETVFRFRLGNTKRAWGYVVQSHFHMVWWERRHMIYAPSR